MLTHFRRRTIQHHRSLDRPNEDNLLFTPISLGGAPGDLEEGWTIGGFAETCVGFDYEADHDSTAGSNMSPVGTLG